MYVFVFACVCGGGGVVSVFAPVCGVMCLCGVLFCTPDSLPGPFGWFGHVSG